MSRTEKAFTRMLAGAVVAVLVAGSAFDVGAQELRRHLSSYLLLTMKRAALKTLRIGIPCNVGVNCGAPTEKSKCGVLSLGRVTAVDGGQAVGAQTNIRKPGEKVWQLFRHNDSPPHNVVLLGPPPNPAPFVAPLT